MKVLLTVLGIAAVLLGGLWLLQGLGLVHVKPILCFADCAPVQGPSALWAVVGGALLLAGLAALARAMRRR
jgi:hypothetical protein